MTGICCICGGQTRHVHKVYYGEFIQIQGYEYQHISLCSQCGYIFAANPCPLEKTNNYYETTKRYAATKNRMERYLKSSKRQMRFIMDAVCLESLESVLEIGATSGCSLNLYKALGLEVCGTELSMQNVEYAKRHYNIELCQMDFDGFYDANKKAYDLVILSNVLEHIINPCSFMKQVSSINSKYLFVSVPSFDYRYIDVPYGIFIPTHHSYFTLESLKNLMRGTKYKLADAVLLLGGELSPNIPYSFPQIQTVWIKHEVDTFRSMLPTISSEQYLKTYLEESQKLTFKIAEIIKHIPDEMRLAVWCLSTHTAFLLKNTELGQKNIIKFYDSNDTFYKRKVMGRKVDAFSKADLELNGIEGILISSYEHQISISKQIEDSCVKCEIITLY